MKKSRLLGAVCACVFSFITTSSYATLITRSAYVDLEQDGRVIAFSGLDAWEGIVAIDDLSFQTGDTLDLQIRFKNNKSLKLTDSGGGNGLELSKLTLLFEDASNNGWNTSGTYTYIGVGGDLLMNNVPFRISGGGWAYQGPFNHENLTDSSFSYTGIDIQVNFDSYQLISGPGIFNAFEWSSGAEDVQIVDTPASVPEPPILYLLVPGLLGLIGITRKKST